MTKTNTNFNISKITYRHSCMSSQSPILGWLALLQVLVEYREHRLLSSSPLVHTPDGTHTHTHKTPNPSHVSVFSVLALVVKVKQNPTSISSQNKLIRVVSKFQFRHIWSCFTFIFSLSQKAEAFNIKSGQEFYSYYTYRTQRSSTKFITLYLDLRAQWIKMLPFKS